MTAPRLSAALRRELEQFTAEGQRRQPGDVECGQ